MLLHHPFNFTSKESISTFCYGANACTLEQIQSKHHTLLALKKLIAKKKNIYIYYQEAQGDSYSSYRIGQKQQLENLSSERVSTFWKNDPSATAIRNFLRRNIYTYARIKTVIKQQSWKNSLLLKTKHDGFEMKLKSTLN